MESVGVTTAIDHAGMSVDTAGILALSSWQCWLAWMYAEKPDDNGDRKKVVNVFLSSSQADVTLSPTDTVYIFLMHQTLPFTLD